MPDRDPFALGGAWDQNINILEVLAAANNASQNDLMTLMLVELKIIRRHLQEMTGSPITKDDVNDHD